MDAKNALNENLIDQTWLPASEVGAIMNLTRERIRQVEEVRRLAKLEALSDTFALRDYVDEGPVGTRRLPTLQAVAKEAEEEKPDVTFDADEFASAVLDAE